MRRILFGVLTVTVVLAQTGRAQTPAKNPALAPVLDLIETWVDAQLV